MTMISRRVQEANVASSAAQQDASVQNHQQGFAQIAMRLSGRDLGQQQSGVR